MTVCIAAIYDDKQILGASDRMVTGGHRDIEFEPPAPKILNITNSIAVMTAGDINIQMQVYYNAYQSVGEKIKADPDKWVNVSDVAEIYSKCFYDLRNKLVENAVLSQYKLNLDSFISRQNDLNQDFIDELKSKIEKFPSENIGNIETILAGIDSSGPHIYVVRNGVIDCNDTLGFASIGIGSYHALSHFMFSAYSRKASEPKALLTVHQAKKKAEVSPGVGGQTDMCHIGPMPGTLTTGFESVVRDMDAFYKKYKKQIEREDTKIEEQIKDYLIKLTTPPPPQKQESTTQPTLQPPLPQPPGPPKEGV